MYHRRRAFTLIELLVVISIIAILTSMILAALSLLRDSAETLVSKQRMQDVRKGLLERSTGNSAVLDAIQAEALGQPLQLRPLRVVLTELVREHGLDLESAADQRTLPPHIASIYDKIGCWKPTFYKRKFKWFPLREDDQMGLERGGQLQRSATLDNVILFGDFRDFHGDVAFYHPDDVDVTEAAGTVPYYRDLDQRNNDQRTHLWYRRDLKPEIVSGSQRHAWVWSHKSRLGETLDTTLEVLPDGLHEPDWYLQRWPLLSETVDGDGVVQRAWPDSDWNQAEPGVVAPVWETPFGHPILRRTTGELAEDQYLVREAGGEGRTLADFSPLHTLTVLEHAGIMPQVDAGTEYRRNRNRELPFNDRWGNPLVAGVGLFIAPRYGLDPADPAEASHGHDREYFGDLLGGRDWYWRRCKDVYGFNRAVYVSVGAMGERRLVEGDDNPVASEVDGWEGTTPLRWAEADDDVVLRAAWLQVGERCGAADFDDEAMSDSPWSDEVTKAKHDGSIVGLLSAPVTVR